MSPCENKKISYSPQYFDHLEAILNFFDERNGSDKFSKKLLKMIHKQIGILATMPEIGRITDFPGVRVLFVERFASISEKMTNFVHKQGCVWIF